MSMTYPVLVEIAIDQHGLLTRAQALEAGVSTASVERHVRAGRLVPVAHGIYHVGAVPADELTPFQQAVLWAGPESMISHASTLEMLHLGDLAPVRMHVTLPPGSRRARGVDRSQYHVHRTAISEEDITYHEGIRIMTPQRAIASALQFGEDPEQVGVAIREGSREGYLTRAERARLTRAVRSSRLDARLAGVVA